MDNSQKMEVEVNMVEKEVWAENMQSEMMMMVREKEP